jgi:hypothetical protein
MLVLFLDFWGGLHTDFHSGCINLHPYQGCISIPFFLTSFCRCLFYNDSHSENSLGNVARFKINIKKLVAFLYINKENTEKEIKKTILFTIASKNFKA